MRKSILFAILAMIIYLISTAMITVFMEKKPGMNLPSQKEIPVKEKFTNLKIVMNSDVYYNFDINACTGQATSKLVKEENQKETKPEYLVNNDTLILNIGNEKNSRFLFLDINSCDLQSITVKGNKFLTVNLNLSGKTKSLNLNGAFSMNFETCYVDTLNILCKDINGITLNESQIKALNFYGPKSNLFHFEVNKGPIPTIHYFEEDSIQKQGM
jgi:hypothetical protein